jgi:hypothetical protein
MIGLLVSKNDSSRRTGIINDWIGYEDIGKSFNGVIFPAEEYYRVEKAYLNFIRELAVSLKVTEFEIRSVMINRSLPAWIPSLYSGRVVDLDLALLLVKRILRNGDFGCVFAAPGGISISVETDYYLFIEVPDGQIGVLDLVGSNGLTWVQVDSGRSECSGEAIVRVLDNEFWAEVGERSPDFPVVVLNRWANGGAGEGWHLIPVNGERQFVQSILPGSAVAVLFGVAVDWQPRLWIFDRIRESVGGDEPALVFSRPVGTTLLESVSILEGVDSFAASDLPAGGELGWIPYPDFSEVEDGGVDALRAVSSTGSIWNKEMTLVW